MERISSRQNAQIKLACKVARSSRERARAGLTLLEGSRLIDSYAQHFGLSAATLLVDERAAGSATVRSRIDALAAGNVLLLTEQLFRVVTQMESPEGLIAIVDIPKLGTSVPDDFRVLLDGVQDPGNLGGLLRTAAAAGATSAHLGRGCADPWSPKALRGGMGAQFVLPLREDIDLGQALHDFSGTVIATSPRADRSLFQVDLSGPVAMIFGSEGRGLDESVLKLANQPVSIPMVGAVESLNVAAAAAICCFERLRQVRSHGMLDQTTRIARTSY